MQFLFLASFYPFLHNHPLEEPERDNCPALIIRTSFVSSIFALTIFVYLVYPFIIYIINHFQKQILPKDVVTYKPPRSPPSPILSH